MATRNTDSPEYLSHYKQRLDVNRKQLLDDVSVEDVLDQLIQDGIVDHDDSDQIQAEKGRKQKITALIDMIYHRGPNAYKCFRAALQDKSDWIVEELDNTKIESSQRKMAINFDINRQTFFKISHDGNVMQNWKSLARLLGLSDSDVINIEYANRGPLSDSVHEMLVMWQTRKGKHATAKALGEALLGAKMQGVLDDLNS